MFATCDSVTEAPQAQFHIFPENPRMGFYIACIDNGKFLCSRLRCSVDMPHENGSFNWSVYVYQIPIEVYMCIKFQLKCTCVSNCNWSIHHTLPVIGNETFELVQGYDCATGAIHYKQPGKGAYLYNHVLGSGCDHHILLYLKMTHSWYMNGVDMQEKTPLLYPGNTGKYVCTTAGESVNSAAKFVVTSIISCIARYWVWT